MRLLPILLLLVLPHAAQATQDGWPALFDVTGVAIDDVLNVRAAPDASAPIVGTLAPDARGVEVIRANDRLTWGLVTTRERSGWVSLAFLERRPGQWDGAFPALASCVGTEPFWSLTLEGDAATLTTPESRIEGTVVARLGSLNRRDRHGLRVALPEGRSIAGVISTEACSDGMSDRAYGLALDALHGEAVLSGCCSLGD
jgi:hypothetical protein